MYQCDIVRLAVDLAYLSRKDALDLQFNEKYIFDLMRKSMKEKEEKGMLNRPIAEPK